jgi:altronate dehydratase small subunit
VKGEVIDGAVLRLAPDDTVATALQPLEAGRRLSVDGRDLEVAEHVPFGHKVALAPAGIGDPVRKYGETIGRASAAIEAGEHVHVHNCESARGRGDIAAGDRDGDREGPA